jgi:choline kinase
MTNAIILAAGLGSRLSPLTDDKPKSLIKFGQETLLERNIAMLRKYGIEDISIVTGYKKEKINFSGINYYENKNYKDNSTLASLFFAEEKILESTIITYSDIIFDEFILQRLLNTKNEISVVIDKNWIEYWNLRIDESIVDATETAIFNEKNLVTSIGKKNPNANGHFIGLMKLEQKGSKIFRNLYYESQNSSNENSNTLNKKITFEKLRIVDLLQGLIDKNNSINSLLIHNGWLEFDSLNDYKLYSEMLDDGSISKLIKLNYSKNKSE